MIGPEVPLVDGLADRLRARGALVFGPGADGARLEGSKAWMKEVLAAAGCPPPPHRSFGADEVDAAVAFLRTLPGLYVVKTDGLAAGKGVLVTESLAEAIDGRAGEAGRAGRSATPAGRVVIEEGMSGPEVSLLCLCDGRRAVPLASAQDYKRRRRRRHRAQHRRHGRLLARCRPSMPPRASAWRTPWWPPTLHELRRRGIDYRGVLYAGLMLTPDGPKVLEYNVRFGDPETQVVLPRWTGDVAAVLADVRGGFVARATDLRGRVAR